MVPRAEDFARLCEDEWAIVFRTAYLITGDRAEAEDLTQEAFLRAYERWSTVSTLDRPQAWLQRVVVNLALSWHRRVGVRRRVQFEQPAIQELVAIDQDVVVALRALPPRQRMALVLRFFADQSVEEVATALGRKPGTVRALTAQGISRLRALEPDKLKEVLDEDAR
jgi:RNA polymerase sigma-70 factor (sigma-E family)